MFIICSSLLDWKVLSINIKDKYGQALRRELTATYVMMAPYVINPTPPNPTGLDPDIVSILSRKLNIKFTFKWVKDFTENIKLVLYGKSDMALSQPTFVHQRYRHGLDISTALTLRTFYFFKRHPVPADSMYTVCLPFSRTVWLATICSIVAIGTALALLNRYLHCVIKSQPPTINKNLIAL